MRYWLALVAICPALHATQFHQIDSTCSFPCTFSSRHHNRVQILDGRVKKAICPTGQVSLLMEELSGQLFVHLLEDFAETVTLSVVSDKGKVQDLEIRFVDRPAEVVILKDGGIQELEAPLVVTESRFDLVGSVLEGNVPPGYVCRSVDKKNRSMGIGVDAICRGHLEGPYQRLFVYEIKNLSLIRRELNEEELFMEGCQFVCLKKRALKHGEKTFAVVAVAK